MWNLPCSTVLPCDVSISTYQYLVYWCWHFNGEIAISNFRRRRTMIPCAISVTADHQLTNRLPWKETSNLSTVIISWLHSLVYKSFPVFSGFCVVIFWSNENNKLNITEQPLPSNSHFGGTIWWAILKFWAHKLKPLWGMPQLMPQFTCQAPRIDTDLTALQRYLTPDAWFVGRTKSMFLLKQAKAILQAV